MTNKIEKTIYDSSVEFIESKIHTSKIILDSNKDNDIVVEIEKKNIKYYNQTLSILKSIKDIAVDIYGVINE